MDLKMDKQTVEFLVFLIGIVVKYGVPEVKNMIEYLDKEEITRNDLLDLMIDKEPESFFK